MPGYEKRRKGVLSGKIRLCIFAARMKYSDFFRCLVAGLLSFSGAVNVVMAQDEFSEKGRFYIYWGWNQDAFSRSNIHLKGNDYNFTLSGIRAADRPTGFDPKIYFNPGVFTIPQYNFRVGYFVGKRWNISFGVDHMKYVMQNNQEAWIDGHISTPESSFQGVYNRSRIVVSPELLTFEHTDGLNYVNLEARYHYPLYESRPLQVSFLNGAGAGMLIPKTNSQLLMKPRNDQFHVAGYGLGAVTGIRVGFYRYFFVQSELKGGFIHMPDILTSPDPHDRASQKFWFGQVNIVFGSSFSF